MANLYFFLALTYLIFFILATFCATLYMKVGERALTIATSVMAIGFFVMGMLVFEVHTAQMRLSEYYGY